MYFYARVFPVTRGEPPNLAWGDLPKMLGPSWNDKILKKSVKRRNFDYLKDASNSI
jgi:hypothetical protein